MATPPLPPIVERQIAVVRTYGDLQAALRARSVELRLRREDIDAAMATLPDGYAAKLLAPVPVKGIGQISLGPLLAALGLKLIVAEDERTARLVVRRAVRVRTASDGQLPMQGRKKRRYPKLGAEWARIMNARRLLLVPPQKRIKIARQAGKARQAKARTMGGSSVRKSQV